MTSTTSRRAVDRAALVLRIGTAFSLAMLVRLSGRPAGALFGPRPPAPSMTVLLTVLAVLVVVGLFTRAAAALLSIAALAFAFLELRAGADWFSLPVRNAELCVVFAALALTGGGALSIDRALRRDRTRDRATGGR